LSAGIGQSLVEVRVPSCTSASVEIECDGPEVPADSVALAGNVGEPITLVSAGATILGIEDPQGVLRDLRIHDGMASAVLQGGAGALLVLARVSVGKAPQWREFKIAVGDRNADLALAEKLALGAGTRAAWAPIDLRGVFNGDVRAIFKQHYLSPRPATCSLRLAEDGYSTWQMMLDPKNAAPVPSLDLIDGSRDFAGQVSTSRGVPFAVGTGASNIGFVSLWDNWPRRIAVPVGRSGEEVWMLVCGFTPPMQVRISNAALRLKYADGVVETIDLVPPFNFWSLCRFGNADYDYPRDFAALPKTPPETLQLGENCRAVVLHWRLRRAVALKEIELEALSPEVVVGLMGVTVMNPAK
jgi:hypothetical protein